MKKELKTLKDLEFASPIMEEKLKLCAGMRKWIKGTRFVSSLILRQEAIKWVKYNNTFQGEDDIDKELEFLNIWIIDFFNLTEEDLK